MSEPDPCPESPIGQPNHAGISGGSSSRRGTLGPSYTDMDPVDAEPVDAEQTFEILEQFRLATSPEDWEQLRALKSKPSDPVAKDAFPAEWRKTIGRFEIHEEIGRGGCGVVFRAYDPKRQQEVALKVPLLTTLVDHELRERFLREAGATAGFDHPNLLSIFEVGNDGMLWYIVAPLCHGPDLSSWMREQSTPVAVNTALRIVAAIADGVSHAHERGLLHRDIKPNNILLDRAVEGSSDQTDPCDLGFIPKLTDFGLAKLISQDQTLTRSGAMIGTTLYMAPEQAEGRINDIGQWTDIYGMGTLLYELLVGRPPISGQSDLETLRRISTDTPVPIRQFRRDVSRDIEAVCLKCLEKNPKHRYPTARALHDDLMRGLEGERTKARPRSSSTRVIARLTRWPWNAATALVCIGILVLTSVWATNSPDQGDSNRESTDYGSLVVAFEAWSKGDHAPMQELFGSFHSRINTDQLDAPGDVVAFGQDRNRLVGWHDPSTGSRHVYQFVGAPFQIRWYTARDVAATLRFNDHVGHLATVTSAEEHRVIVEHLLSKIGELDSKVWIGLSDELTEGEFTWVTGELFSFSTWIVGEPNDTDENEDFVEYLRNENRAGDSEKANLATVSESWGWNDAGSIVDNPRGFIVEYDLGDE